MADQSIPMFLRSVLATGDVIYRAASSTWQRLGIGATDTILSVASGIPAWQSLATLLANAMSNTRGMILRRGASAWEAHDAKTSNQVLAGDGTDIKSQTLYAVIKSIVGGTFANGDILYSNGSNLARLAAGAAGYILQANGAGAPTWVAKGFRLFASEVRSSSTQTVSFSSLSGNTNKLWILFSRVKQSSGGTRFIALRPNSASTNLASEGGGNTGGGSFNDAYGSDVKIVPEIFTGRMATSIAFIWTSKSDGSTAMPMHVLTLSGNSGSGSDTDMNCRWNFGIWNETSTEVSSFDLRADAANGIGAGSSFYLYAMEMP